MEQRPQRLVGIAIIIFVDILFFQVDRRGLHPVIIGKADMAGEIVGRAARPADPDAAAFAQRLRQRHGKATLIGGAIGATDPVGNDYQTAHRITLHGLLSKTAQLMMPTNE